MGWHAPALEQGLPGQPDAGKYGAPHLRWGCARPCGAVTLGWAPVVADAPVERLASVPTNAVACRSSLGCGSTPRRGGPPCCSTCTCSAAAGARRLHQERRRLTGGQPAHRIAPVSRQCTRKANLDGENTGMHHAAGAGGAPHRFCHGLRKGPGDAEPASGTCRSPQADAPPFPYCASLASALGLGPPPPLVRSAGPLRALSGEAPPGAPLAAAPSS